jgi:thymidine kinase
MYEILDRGKVTLITGPMFAGKTTTLINYIEVARHAGLKCLIVRHNIDTRYPPSVLKTHSGHTICQDLQILFIISDSLLNITTDVDIVCVEEGQFFHDVAEACHKWARDGKQVFVTALDGDSDQKMFSPVVKLIPYCDNIEKRHSVCMKCKKNSASFTVKKEGVGPGIVIGGACEYSAVCRKCIM